MFLVLCSLGFFSFSVSIADTLDAFVPVSGVDTTNGSESVLTTTASGDIFKLSLSDDKRMASNLAWPSSGSYDETKYIEFLFNPNIPIESVISSVTITHEYRRATILAATKLEIWDGNIWNDIPLILPDAISNDISETKDIFSIIDTPPKVNGIKIRFLAYRDTHASSATTSHDFLKLTVGYVAMENPSPTSTPLATPDSMLPPQVTPTVETTPSATPTSTLTPTSPSVPSDVSVVSYFSPTPAPSAPPVLVYSPIPTIYMIPTPSFSPTPTPTEALTSTPSLVPTIIANSLVATITTPRAVVRKIPPTPLPSVVPVKPYQPKIVTEFIIIKNKILNIWHWLNRPQNTTRKISY